MPRGVRERHGSVWVTGLAHDLVTTEIAHSPDDVGPPVDVISLSSAGIEWVAVKPACRNDSTDAD